MKYNEKKRLQICMRRLYNTNSTNKEIIGLIGNTKEGFIEHIDKYLLSGMTKENFGKVWGLDHIVPVELFDFSNPDDLRLCYNYNNIMPMFISDNRMKGASVHFSIDKLRSMYTNVFILKLINKCHEHIKTTYLKYLVL
jgi:hypothetical protein